MNLRNFQGLAVSVAIIAAAFAGAPAAAELRPLQVRTATVQGEGQTQLFADIAYELDREVGVPGFGGGKYDNLYIRPIGVRHGLGEGFEVGGFLTYNANSANDDGAPDDAGLGGITTFGKLALNANVAMEVGMRVAGADDVAPYPSDGIDFYVSLPMQRRLGEGLLYGELGYTVQDNDIGGTYANWGVGYAIPINPTLSANIELRGDEAPAGLGNHMDLLFGANVQLDEGLNLRPFISLGLYDASPDIAFGVGVDFRL